MDRTASARMPRRVVRQIAEAPLGPNGSFSAEAFRSRVARYESIYDAMIRLLGVLGRWGDTRDFPPAVEVLRDLAHQEPAGGLLVWINLRAYPAVLALYAYGIGLVKAGRYGVLLQWLETKFRSGRSEQPQTATNLVLHAWEGAERALWRNLVGYEQRKTPLSDHLHERFSAWTRDYTDSEAAPDLCGFMEDCGIEPVLARTCTDTTIDGALLRSTAAFHIVLRVLGWAGDPSWCRDLRSEECPEL